MVEPNDAVTRYVRWKPNWHIRHAGGTSQEWDFGNLRYPYPIRRVMLSGLMISLVILVEAAGGMAGKFEEFIMEEAADVIAHEPGCLQFLVSRSKDDPNLFTLAEFYADEAALEA